MRKLYFTAALTFLSFFAFGQLAPNYITPAEDLAPEGEGGVTIDMIGSASITGSSEENLAQGTTGIAFYKTGIYQGSVVFSLGTSADIDFTGTEKKGSNLLIPGNGAGSLQFDFKKYGIFKLDRFGFNVSFVGAGGEWLYNNTSYNVSPVSFKLQASGLILNETTDLVNIMLTADFGLSYRGFFGDASQDDELKQAIFGTTQTNFFGFELNADLWINDTHFFFSFPFLMGDQVKGLTDGQILLGAVVSGRVLKNVLKK